MFRKRQGSSLFYYSIIQKRGAQQKRKGIHTSAPLVEEYRLGPPLLRGSISRSVSGRSLRHYSPWEGGWKIPGVGYIPYPSSTIRPALRSKEGNENGIKDPVSKKERSWLTASTFSSRDKGWLGLCRVNPVQEVSR